MSEAWLEYVRVLWPVIGGIGGLLTVVILLLLRTKFTPLEEHRALATRMTVIEGGAKTHEQRLNHVEAVVNQSPTRQELSEDIGALAARMTGVEAGLRGIDQRLATHNDYLHTLIEQGLKGGGK